MPESKVHRRKKYAQTKVHEKPEIVVPPTTSKTTGFFTSLSFSVVIFLLVLYYRDVIREILPFRSSLTRPIGLPPVFHVEHTSPKHTPELFWGTYRPNVYFGIRHRSPRSLFAGLAWFDQAAIYRRRNFLRHFCEEHNGIKQFGWIAHDGKTFGLQTIKDEGFTVITEWAKEFGGDHGGDWTARIKVKPDHANARNASFVSLLFYFSYERPWIDRKEISDNGFLSAISGHTSELGEFNILFRTPTMKNSRTVSTSFAMSKDEFYLGYPMLHSMVNDNGIVRLSNDIAPDSTSVAVQVDCVEYPCEFEIVFESASHVDRQSSLVGKRFSSVMKQRYTEFGSKFHDVFGMTNVSVPELKFAHYVLSNLLGGIGYFYGRILVSNENEKPQYYWPAGLFTSVPSRSFFPRGFLWDEAFHNLVILKWDFSLSLEIFGHYLDLMNANGWIPRELILGKEALMKVPSEFVIQYATHANPPAWLLTLNYFDISKNASFFQRAFPRLMAWFKWFNDTQKGELDGTYRWRGRNTEATSELNPKTLTSGLDDYPRASYPTSMERHLDLRCWMAMSAKSLSKLSEILGRHDLGLAKLAASLYDEKKLSDFHWSGYAYLDWGLHTDNLKLRKRPPANTASDRRAESPEVYERVLTGAPPTYQFVPHIGYVSLFPFLMKIISPNSSHLHFVLSHMKDPDVLWSRYGLRSLAKNSSFYNRRNTVHDPPYWRGAIWIHFNFLALRSLKFYASVDGPYKKLADEIYISLRGNVINTIFSSYNDTGYVWEQYNDVTGNGQFSHPFTGWTSLVLLIMSEQYD